MTYRSWPSRRRSRVTSSARRDHYFHNSKGGFTQLLYEQLRHMEIRHFVIIECRHLANGCILKCGCIGLMLFRNLSCLGTIICYINTIGIVPAYACNVCDALVASHATAG